MPPHLSPPPLLGVTATHRARRGRWHAGTQGALVAQQALSCDLSAAVGRTTERGEQRGRPSVAVLLLATPRPASEPGRPLAAAWALPERRLGCRRLHSRAAAPERMLPLATPSGPCCGFLGVGG